MNRIIPVRTSLLTLTVLVASCITSNAVADHHETCSPDQFRELGNRLVGRWSSEIKFIANWPGEEKGRGERVNGFAEFTWAADKNVIRGVETGGMNSGYWTLVRNPISKKIRILIGNTGGSVVEVEMWPKSSDTYGWRITSGGEADGRELTGSGEWVFSDGGKTLTMQGRATLAGEELDPYKDVYSRLSP